MHRVPPLIAAALASGAAPPVTAAEDPGAHGRRVLSTAFVMIGADGHLTVGQRDGSVVVLRDVTMGARRYCGTRVGAPAASKRFCGGYPEVVSARPGGGPLPGDAPSLDRGERARPMAGHPPR